MSRPYYDVKEIYIGNGSLASYTFDFKITDVTQLLIVVIDNNGDEVERVRGDDVIFLDNVTFSVDDNSPGGVVNLLANLPAGYKIAILLSDDTPTQNFEFRNKTSFTLRKFENALDAIVGFIQGMLLRTKQSIRISDFDDEVTFNTQLPARITDNASRTIIVDSAGSGFDYGPNTDEVANAQAYGEAAALSALSAAESAGIATDGAEEASLLLFDGNENLSDLDSPVNFGNYYADKIVFVDASNGDIEINLETIPGYVDGFKAQFIRKDDSANLVNVNAYSGETIDGLSVYSLPKGLTVIISIDSETNWKKKFIGLVNGGSTLPIGVTAGDYLENDGADAIWKSGLFSGFSARYNTALDLPDLRAALLYIFNFSYIAPTISLSCSPSQTVREKGASVASVVMSATTVKKALDITAVTHFRNSVLVDTEAAPIAGGGVETFTESTPFSDTMTFFSKVFDGTTLVQSNTVTYSYAYPYYEGVGAAALDATGIVANLTKVVRASTANVAVTSSPVGQKIYFCYPAAYADLTSILDPSSFEILSAFTKRLVTITGLDGTPQSYKVYELNALTTQTGYTITFKR